MNQREWSDRRDGVAWLAIGGLVALLNAGTAVRLRRYCHIHPTLRSLNSRMPH